MYFVVAWVVLFSPASRPPTHCSRVTKISSPQLLVFPRLTNCDACNPFRPPPFRAVLARRIHYYENCRVWIRLFPWGDLTLCGYPHSLLLITPYLFSFQPLAHSFALVETSTLLFSMASALFAKNHPGWGVLPSKCSYQRQHLDPFACVFSASSRVYQLE